VTTETTFVPVTIADPSAGVPTDMPQSMSAPSPVIVERSTPGIEVELTVRLGPRLRLDLGIAVRLPTSDR
jgi:hypothetical protein